MKGAYVFLTVYLRNLIDKYMFRSLSFKVAIFPEELHNMRTQLTSHLILSLISFIELFYALA